jgi:serine/threonine-protein kinase RsbW
MATHSATTIPELPPREFQRDNLILRIDVTIAADPSAISPVVAGIMEIARRMDCIAGKELEIETALREALANAITHGCRSDRSKKVQCSVACDEDRSLVILVRDPGLGFDPRRVPKPTRIQNLYSSHGRGIYLINELMDEVRFERGGSQIVMRKQ